MYNLYCEFDLEKHKETYINYLEVVILRSGKIVYAVPSHQEKAIAIAMEQLGKTRGEIETMCPPEMYANYLEWLLGLTNSIAVWSDDYIGKPNHIQQAVIQKLQNEYLLERNE